MPEKTKKTKAVTVRKDSFALDNPAAFETALKAEKEKRTLIQKFIKSQLKENVDYGVIVIKGRNGQEYKSKPTLFKSGTEKFASLLKLTPVFVEDELTLKQVPEALKQKGVFAYKCVLLDINDRAVSEGRGATLLSEMNNDINRAVKIAQKRAQTDAVLRLGLSDSFTQDLDDEGEKDYKATREKIMPDVKKKELLIHKFRKMFDAYCKMEKPNNELKTFLAQIDILENAEIEKGIVFLNRYIAKAKRNASK